MKPAAPGKGRMETGRTRGRAGEVALGRRLPEDGARDAPPWEMVGAGRYMPRRIRGSCRGRELG